MADGLHIHADYVEPWSAFIVATLMKAPHARSVHEEMIKYCDVQHLKFTDQGNHTKVLDDLRYWLLNGNIAPSNIVFNQGEILDAVQKGHQDDMKLAKELGDSDGEDMEPRRKAAAEKDRANIEARAAALPGVALADRNDSSRNPCTLCRNVESRKCPRCAGCGTEPGYPSYRRRRRS